MRARGLILIVSAILVGVALVACQSYQPPGQNLWLVCAGQVVC